MREEEFIALTIEKGQTKEEFARLKAGIPLGVDAAGDFVLSQTCEHAYTCEHTCVTGTRRSVFIRRLICLLSCLYTTSELDVLVLSPYAEYGELLRLHGADVTVPYVRTIEDLNMGKSCLKELLSQYASGGKYPKLFLVLDGLEELPMCNDGGVLEEYRTILELVAREKNVHVISGVDLMKSIFSGNPGVFVGVGNSLITTREDGFADVTYVKDDSSLSVPIAIRYPNEPSLTETIIHLNAKSAKSAE
jgi:hypothetical protein